MHYVFANATVSLGAMLEGYPGGVEVRVVTRRHVLPAHGDSARCFRLGWLQRDHYCWEQCLRAARAASRCVECFTLPVYRCLLLAGASAAAAGRLPHSRGACRIFLRPAIVDHAKVGILTPGAAPHAAQAFYVQFPDPHFKRRHRKRRLLQPDTVKAIAAALKPGGVWAAVEGGRRQSSAACSAASEK